MTTGKQIQKAAGCETKGNAPICMYTVGLEVIAGSEMTIELV